VTALRAFLPSELVLAAGLAVIIEGSLFILLVTAANKTHITAHEEKPPEPVPIQVKPVLDELPMLKLGSKKMRAKLPDMWTKKPPIKRVEAASAPSPKAEATKEKIPETPVVKKDKEAPKPDAAVAKKVDEQPKTEDDKPQKEQNLPEEGSPDGVKEGTEADPLKAFAVGQYRIKISGWFNARFKRPTGEIPCDELKKLKASVVASISGERTVTGYSITKPSGNSVFDERVKATMEAIKSGGSELPPPPPNYEDILGSSISVGFHVTQCD
jgi:outer membrane biosynthesis protein TonB